MKTLQQIFTVVILFILIIRCASAQPQLAWQAHYNSSLNSTDKAIGIAVDGNCNTYITGQSDSIGTGTNIVTIKYDENGIALWRVVYDGTNHLDDVPSEIKIDNNGNAYICGKTGTSTHGSDWVLIKYSNTGVFDWASTRNSTTNADDLANDLVIDDVNNVIYVCGNLDTKAGVSKYNSSGAGVWHFTSTPGTTSYTDEAHKLTLSGSGNVIVMIHEYWNVTNDAEFLSLNPSTGSSTSFYFQSFVVPIDFVLNGSGEAFVLGYYKTSLLEELRVYRSSNTTFLYNRTSVNDIQNRNGSIKVDGSNNIYFTTLEDVDASAGVNNQFLTAKLNSTGTLQWLNNYGSTDDDQGMFLSLTQGGTPNVIVGGFTTNGSNDKDFTFLKYNNAGVLQPSFTTSYDIGGADDIPTGMQLDQYGNVFLTGFSGVSGSEDFTTLKYCVNSYPVAVVNVNGDSLYCNPPAVSYQWFKNGVVVLGATERGINLITHGNGNYFCVATQYCCTDTTNTVNMTTVGVSSVDMASAISIYPNPAHTSFTIQNNSKSDKLEMQIMDMVGKVVYSERLEGENENTIQLHLNAGVYILQVTDGKKTMLQKLVIQ